MKAEICIKGRKIVPKLYSIKDQRAEAITRSVRITLEKITSTESNSIQFISVFHSWPPKQRRAFYHCFIGFDSVIFVVAVVINPFIFATAMNHEKKKEKKCQRAIIVLSLEI